jgi:Uri superfamily endonuclease
VIAIINKIKAYILIIQVKRKFRTKVGAKGDREFDQGYYLYVGSGKKNLVQRIKRHLSMEKRKFWHIDYLLGSTHASVRDIYLTELTEDAMVKRLEKNRYTKSWGSSFGATDSKNRSHLFYCGTYADIRRLRGSMEKWL